MKNREFRELEKPVYVKFPKGMKPAFKISEYSLSETERGSRVLHTFDQRLKEIFAVTHYGQAWVYNHVIQVNLSTLAERIEELEKFEGDDIVDVLLPFVRDEYEVMLKRFDLMIEDGKISFPGLGRFFKEGLEVYGKVFGEKVSGTIVSTDVRFSWTGVFFDCEIKVYKPAKSSLGVGRHTLSIGHFDGVAPIDSLEVKVLDEGTKAELAERGRTFQKFARKASYASYSGKLVRRTWWGDMSFPAEGRVMIDLPSFCRVDPEGVRGFDRYLSIDDSLVVEGNLPHDNVIPEDKLHTTWPFLYGFSMRSKKWGEMAVSGLSDIVFRTDVVENLVLDEDTKKMIVALVKHNDGAFTDLVDGKSGGCIFLLHGDPGVGKTLTAEAVAETLQRPLYPVSVGELGTDPNVLEESLRKILDLGSIWNAVILLDEADIFLEKRDENDIVRNAMVGIFLRLLEYHHGVMFLTTNRVKNFDPAFHSRISMAIKYPNLTAQSRLQVWKNLLSKAGVAGLDAEKLADYDINGRQIKSAIRLAQTLAKSEGVDVSMAHVMKTIEKANQFQKDIAA